jgi:hypothetical protein
LNAHHKKINRKENKRCPHWLGFKKAAMQKNTTGEAPTKKRAGMLLKILLKKTLGMPAFAVLQPMFFLGSGKKLLGKAGKAKSKIRLAGEPLGQQPLPQSRVFLGNEHPTAPVVFQRWRPKNWPSCHNCFFPPKWQMPEGQSQKGF